LHLRKFWARLPFEQISWHRIRINKNRVIARERFFSLDKGILLMLKARSVCAVCGLYGLTLVFGCALPGCDSGSGENEVIAPAAPRQGRDTMDAYKADMKKKAATKPGR